MKTEVPYIYSKIHSHVDPKVRLIAIRTAFVARFIVLREGRRSRAHRIIEDMYWEEETTATELAERIRNAFVQNGDKLTPIDRDIDRALTHAGRSAEYFVEQYIDRSTNNFQEALRDYERSNELIFGLNGQAPRKGGWRLPEIDNADESKNGSQAA